MKALPAISKPPLHYRVCNYCEAMCGVEVTYQPQAETDELKIRVMPDKNDPFSRGSMCPKAAALGPLYYDPSRLKHPVKKVGDEWQQISWEEAYSTVAKQIKSIQKQYGKNSVACYFGNPIVHNLGMMVFLKSFTRAIGSKNIFSATSMDQLPHHFAAHYMFGNQMKVPVPDINRTDYMILMGANPLASNGSIMTSAGVTRRLHEIESRGGKFVVIDPRKTETAKIASEHYFIKPATDVFFLLSFLHILFRDHKVRLGHLQNHVSGFDKLEPLFEEFSPEKVTTITAIAADTIERLVEEFLSHEQSVVYGRMGLSTQPHGGLCHWLINCINLLSGNFDSAGGMMFTTPAIDIAGDKPQREQFGRWKSRVRGLKEFGGELPVSAMAEEMLTEGEGQVKAFISICGNPVLSSPGGNRLDPALENIEFMLSIDNYINETTRHADIILPTPSGLEIDHYDLIFNLFAVSNNAKFSEALFPVGDDRPYDWQVLKELSHRISAKGLSLAEKIMTPRRMVNWGLMLGPYGKLSSPKRWFNGLSLRKLIKSKHGINLGPLQPRIPQGLDTLDKKINLAADVFINRLKEVQQDEYPALLQAAKASSGKVNFSYIGRRNVSTNNTWMHQVKKLSRSKQARCTLMINPDDAERLQIFDGEEVKASSRVGEIILPAEITAEMMPGVVSIPHGFGHNKKDTRVPYAEAKPGVSVNDITDHTRLDKLTGNAAFSGLPVEIVKITNVVKSKQRSGKPLTIIYGSQSGNAEMIAVEMAKSAAENGLLSRVLNMNEVDLDTLAEAERILFIVSTFGEGDMPDNAEDLWQKISAKDAPQFNQNFYSVLALGDKSYENFCAAGKCWDKRLSELGATRIQQLLECDVDYVESSDKWVQSILPVIAEKGDQSIIVEIGGAEQPEKPKRYNSQNPMLAELRVKRLLNQGSSSKQTMHYELSLREDYPTYEVGDALYLIPQNSPDLVDQLIAFAGFNANEIPSAQHRSIRELLLEELEIRTPSQDTLSLIARYCKDSPLNALKDDADSLSQYLWGKDLLSLLQLHPEILEYKEALFTTLKPILPRAYSIASSASKHPSEVHLTVATLSYQIEQRMHHGVSSSYLADRLQVGDKIKCYFVANKHFSVPENSDAAMIMIGPGTGIAPFRGFLQEREFRKHRGDNWLFFGDRNADCDFLYQQEFEAMQKDGLLTQLDVAFSRDQKEKIYVQHRMLEQAEKLFGWLENGAFLFVCGDADFMAKDVEQTLHEIIQQQGQLSPQQAQDYLDKLKQQKRYVKDVY